MIIWKRTSLTLRTICLVALLGFALRAGEPECDYQWVNVTMNAAFAPRDGAGALVFKDRMWVLEGWNKQNRNDV